MFTYSQHIFFVGIKGVAMANLARILVQLGKHVSGSDVEETFITDEIIESCAIKVIHSFEGDDLPNETELVVYAASHEGRNNPQVVEAEQRNIKVLHQSELLSQLMKLFNTSIAVAGCHGKTTTTALLSFALKKLTPEMSYMVGTSSFNGWYGGDYDGTQYFVVEADEYGIDPPDNLTPKFHLLNPDYAIITNIDHDHPDVYPSIYDTKKAFQIFMNKLLQKDFILPHLIVCEDDENIPDLQKSMKRDSFITYGFSKQADVQIMQMTTSKLGSHFYISSKLFELQNVPVQINLFGEMNTLNAAAVLTLLLQLGFSKEKIIQAMHGFTGAKRRFEYVGKTKKIILYDDYAHHPAEISATIAAARLRFPNKRLVVLFQPHTYSRTEKMKHEFVKALSQADKVVLLPIFPSAREKQTDNKITSEVLAELGNKMNTDTMISSQSKDEAMYQLEVLVKPNDLIITMGAGDVYMLGKHILEIAEKK